MKVGIITTQFAINYGAVLQATALQHSIEGLGADCEIIDYQPINKKYGRNLFREITGLKSVLYNILVFANIPFRRGTFRRIAAFNCFLKKVKLSDKVYTNVEQLIEQLPSYDVFVCGSDQIWNLNLMEDKSFFLPFNEKYPNSRYIAYAPSIAEDLSLVQKQMLAENIAHFDAISSREHSGAALLTEIIGSYVPMMVDPVFHLNRNEWMKMAAKSKENEQYIFCFFISCSEEAQKIVKKVRRKLNRKLVLLNLGLFDKLSADEEIRDASPSEFLRLICNAEFIVTDSFHASAFSLIFEIPFLTVASPTRNSRMESLFEQVGVENRLIHGEDAIREEHFQMISSDIAGKLEMLANSGKDFLQNSIWGDKNAC